MWISVHVDGNRYVIFDDLLQLIAELSEPDCMQLQS